MTLRKSNGGRTNTIEAYTCVCRCGCGCNGCGCVGTNQASSSSGLKTDNDSAADKSGTSAGYVK